MADTDRRERWTKGYTQQELDRAQEIYGLKFPPDLVALLLDRRLIDAPDWRIDDKIIRSTLTWPFEGLLFDVERNGLWWPEWGERPVEADDRKEVLSAALDQAPKLIPLFSHRYLPEQPYEAGNPVFSVYQSDVIYYGADLDDYFVREFSDDPAVRRASPKPLKSIPFWADMVSRSGLYTAHSPRPRKPSESP